MTTDLDDLLAENNAVGAWEQQGSGMTGVQRWLFPRFTPICPKHDVPMVQSEEDGSQFSCEQAVGKGTCKEARTMDPGDMYLSRSGIGPYDTDVETIAAWLNARRNRVGGVLLLGKPGTGKTSLAQAAVTYAERRAVIITATPDHTKDSLFKNFVGEGNGSPGANGEPTPFVLGQLVEAAINGWTIIVDEFLLFVDGLKPIFYAFADGSHWLPEAMIDGSAAPIHPEPRLIITANPDVRGASLPEPIASRFASTTVTVRTAAPMLRDMSIDESIVGAWESLGNLGLWRPEIRELRMADYWLNLDATQACSAFLPEHCPESQRKDIRDTVMGFLGGNLPEDGRLVVE